MARTIVFVFLAALAPLAVAQNNLEKTIQAKAQESGAALLRADYGKVVDLTYPKVVELAGGRDKLIELLKAGMDQMKSEGFSFISAEMAAPSQVVTSGDRM